MNFLKKLFGIKDPEPITEEKLSPKDAATARGEPYVNVTGLDIDHNNLAQGAFEIEWNELFVAQLIRAGYKGKTEELIVDQWFQDVCRHVVLETYEQYEANNPRPPSGVQKRDLGNGRTEVS